MLKLRYTKTKSEKIFIPDIQAFYCSISKNFYRQLLSCGCGFQFGYQLPLQMPPLPPHCVPRPEADSDSVGSLSSGCIHQGFLSLVFYVTTISSFRIPGSPNGYGKPNEHSIQNPLFLPKYRDIRQPSGGLCCLWPVCVVLHWIYLVKVTTVSRVV